MSTALALTTSYPSYLVHRSGQDPEERHSPIPLAPLTPTFVYGDSSPFPHELNFIDVVEESVKVSVALMGAQHTLNLAATRLRASQEQRAVEKDALATIASSVLRVLDARGDEGRSTRRVASAAARILEASTLSVQTGIAEGNAELKAEFDEAEAVRAVAHRATFNALETFVRRFDLPGTELSLELEANRGGKYEASVSIRTPYHVQAFFELGIPPVHSWSKLRRFEDVVRGLEIRVPWTKAWFSKPTKTLKLDRMTIRKLHWACSKCSITFGRGGAGGNEYEVAFDPRKPGEPAAFRARRGAESDGTSFDLSSTDTAVLHALKKPLSRVAADLCAMRGAMTKAFFRGSALDVNPPALIANALIAVVAPTARDIARRSGSPGELVLRRDVDARRRDEIYITKAGLVEWIMTLPPWMRRAFDPLELDGPRSPRTPKRSMPSFEEIGEASIIRQG